MHPTPPPPWALPPTPPASNTPSPSRAHHAPLSHPYARTPPNRTAPAPSWPCVPTRTSPAYPNHTLAGVHAPHDTNDDRGLQSGREGETLRFRGRGRGRSTTPPQWVLYTRDRRVVVASRGDAPSAAATAAGYPAPVVDTGGRAIVPVTATATPATTAHDTQSAAGDFTVRDACASATDLQAIGDGQRATVPAPDVGAKASATSPATNTGPIERSPVSTLTAPAPPPALALTLATATSPATTATTNPSADITPPSTVPATAHTSHLPPTTPPACSTKRVRLTPVPIPTFTPRGGDAVSPREPLSPAASSHVAAQLHAEAEPASHNITPGQGEPPSGSDVHLKRNPTSTSRAGMQAANRDRAEIKTARRVSLQLRLSALAIGDRATAMATARGKADRVDHDQAVGHVADSTDCNAGGDSSSSSSSIESGGCQSPGRNSRSRGTITGLDCGAAPSPPHYRTSAESAGCHSDTSGVGGSGGRVPRGSSVANYFHTLDDRVPASGAAEAPTFGGSGGQVKEGVMGMGMEWKEKDEDTVKETHRDDADVAVAETIPDGGAAAMRMAARSGPRERSARGWQDVPEHYGEEATATGRREGADDPRRAATPAHERVFTELGSPSVADAVVDADEYTISEDDWVDAEVCFPTLTTFPIPTTTTTTTTTATATAPTTATATPVAADSDWDSDDFSPGDEVDTGEWEWDCECEWVDVGQVWGEVC